MEGPALACELGHPAHRSQAPCADSPMEGAGALGIGPPALFKGRALQVPVKATCLAGVLTRLLWAGWLPLTMQAQPPHSPLPGPQAAGHGGTTK